MMKNDDWICTWSRKLHDRPRVHSTSHPADERDTPVQRLNTGHNTLLLPSGHFEMEKRWPIFLLDLASCTTVHAALGSARNTVCGSQLTGGSQPFRRLNTLLLPLSGVLCLESVMSDKMSVCGPHNTLLLPSGHFEMGHFEMEKRWLIFCLISQAARRCTRPSARLMRGSQPFRRLYTSHFCCPFLVCCALNLSWESVMSDKMCGCVCVCVCTNSLQPGFPNRFLCFLHLSSVFLTYPNAHAAKISVFFLSTCLFLLPCSQTYMLPLPFSACFPCLAWICVPPSCQIPLLDLEPNTAVNTLRAKSKHHEVLARSIKKQRCLLCSCECSCSFPIKNGLNAWLTSWSNAHQVLL